MSSNNHKEKYILDNLYSINGYRGITLVALVITVIVLLILAGVGISLITGAEGLFSKTRFASEKYNNEAEKEASIINYLANIDARVSIEIMDIEQTKFTIIVKIDNINNKVKEYNFYINDAKYKTIVSENKTESLTITDLEPENEYKYYVIVEDEMGNKFKSEENKIKTMKAEKLLDVVNIGDKVNYLKAGYNKWIVYKNEDVVTLISEGTPTSLGIYGSLGHSQSPQNIQGMVNSYLDSNYAKSVRSVIYEDISDLKNKEMHNIGSEYWMNTGYNAMANGVMHYYMRYIDSAGSEKLCLCSYPGYESGGTKGIRPVVTLKEDILTSGKNSEGVWELFP